VKPARQNGHGKLTREYPLKAVSRSDVTELLQAWSDGDRSVHDRLWPIVFAELNRLAHRYMRRERPDHTLQTGALVNEAYMRLVDWKQAQWRSRAHFFGMCARIMRQILVDHARAHGYEKRGGGQPIATLDEAATVSSTKSEQLVALDEALQRLASIHRRKSDVVELRFFGGLSVEETAEVLKVSRLTVIRDWNFARAWLLAEMSGKNSTVLPIRPQVTP
jgi:RNA polymerase sigma-70 factor, ECF subfamily